MKEAERKPQEKGVLEAREESISTLSKTVGTPNKMRTERHPLRCRLEVTAVRGKSNLSGAVGTQAKVG